jgi:hypothetical protein
MRRLAGLSAMFHLMMRVTYTHPFKMILAACANADKRLPVMEVNIKMMVGMYRIVAHSQVARLLFATTPPRCLHWHLGASFQGAYYTSDS